MVSYLKEFSEISVDLDEYCGTIVEPRYRISIWVCL